MLTFSDAFKQLIWVFSFPVPGMCLCPPRSVAGARSVLLFAQAAGAVNGSIYS